MSITTNDVWYKLPDRLKFIALFDCFEVPIRIWGPYIYAAGRRYKFDLKTGDLIKVEEFRSNHVSDPAELGL